MRVINTQVYAITWRFKLRFQATGIVDDRHTTIEDVREYLPKLKIVSQEYRQSKTELLRIKSIKVTKH